MASRSSSGRCRIFFLAAYSICLVLVFSFLLFEVLDVDGSDFAPPPWSLAPLNAVEASHDIKRIPLLMLPSLIRTVRLVDPSLQGLPSQDQPSGLPARSPVVCSHRYPVTLARASLSEPAPVA